ncbi:MAG: hypothetical protein C0501_05745 [Isosphaera sp.]|nr:hypothetical protein [Isosphaera sp.]
MRKLFFAVSAMLFMAGLVIAAEGTVTKVDTDKKEIVVKDGDKEVTLKYTDKVKVTLITFGKDKKSEEKEGKFEDFEKRLKGFKADSKFPTKLTYEAKDGTITEVKFRSFGGGKNPGKN